MSRRVILRFITPRHTIFCLATPHAVFRHHASQRVIFVLFYLGQSLFLVGIKTALSTTIGKFPPPLASHLSAS
jgi:hypothetical protein